MKKEDVFLSIYHCVLDSVAATRLKRPDVVPSTAVGLSRGRACGVVFSFHGMSSWLHVPKALRAAWNTPPPLEQVSSRVKGLLANSYPHAVDGNRVALVRMTDTKWRLLVGDLIVESFSDIDEEQARICADCCLALYAVDEGAGLLYRWCGDTVTLQ